MIPPVKWRGIGSGSSLLLEQVYLEHQLNLVYLAEHIIMNLDE